MTRNETAAAEFAQARSVGNTTLICLSGSRYEMLLAARVYYLAPIGEQIGLKD
jgi:hypothetical protein